MTKFQVKPYKSIPNLLLINVHYWNKARNDFACSAIDISLYRIC